MPEDITASSVLGAQARQKRELATRLTEIAASQRRIADQLSEQAAELRRSAVMMERRAKQTQVQAT